MADRRFGDWPDSSWHRGQLEQSDAEEDALAERVLREERAASRRKRFLTSDHEPRIESQWDKLRRRDDERHRA